MTRMLWHLPTYFSLNVTQLQLVATPIGSVSHCIPRAVCKRHRITATTSIFVCLPSQTFTGYRLLQHRSHCRLTGREARGSNSAHKSARDYGTWTHATGVEQSQRAVQVCTKIVNHRPGASDTIRPAFCSWPIAPKTTSSVLWGKGRLNYIALGPHTDTTETPTLIQGLRDKVEKQNTSGDWRETCTPIHNQRHSIGFTVHIAVYIALPSWRCSRGLHLTERNCYHDFLFSDQRNGADTVGYIW